MVEPSLVVSPTTRSSGPYYTGRKRSVVSSDHSPRGGEDVQGIRKLRKVSRACDFCKSRKAKCSGDQPCAKCVAKDRVCLYDAKYTRGRPPTPPQSDAHSRLSYEPGVPSQEEDIGFETISDPSQSRTEPQDDMSGPYLRSHDTAPSRASPELSMAMEIQGQVFDPTSGLTFLHRAWKRLSAQNSNKPSDVAKSSAENQPLYMAGDKPLPEIDEHFPIPLPSPSDGRKLLSLYFDVCIATYRILHRPTVESWLSTIEKNIQEKQPVWREIGRARAAIVLVALAVATLHQAKSKGLLSADDDAQALRASDELFVISARLADEESGYPKLESAQARLVHVLYLLTTSRFNRSWYVFGNALQLISALGFHRRASAKRRRISHTDYIHTQCCIRTFWTAYVLDNYLGVVFGRPRHFHDEDIDQEFPDRVNDEEMTTMGPGGGPENPEDCHIDALIFHARIAQIIGCISREVYTLRDITNQERVAAAHKLNQRVHDWHASLPLHLGSIRPSMLITSYRRQATVLKLAHSHAIMHANRLFLLGTSTTTYENQVNECMGAAKAVLETVDYMAQEGPIFHAFWWTHYVTFCALVVTYVWEIQQRRTGRLIGKQNRAKLIELAERCQTHLARATASNSPSRRYAVILEEFRTAAKNPSTRPVTTADPDQPGPMPAPGQSNGLENHGTLDASSTIAGDLGQVYQDDSTLVYDPRLLDEWQTADWLDLDSSAFWPHVEIDETMIWSTMT
ncbi:fungal-specific transcription factor domain-containing protein [Ilyonectria robusta]|uniref:fungal-specific transcription factor domain-containing protein n=1 Tax=Ilyonectria robusta TaxID=1079257 RepID=UPI001E8E0295|nr:fungal-specific transcription factor domain-containing protein [Ilyonectria robusta]KAH8667802.1 fungal-specific transcription factor domain-containing protein [Ilyonectria robusta]